MSRLYAVKLKKTPSEAVKGRCIDMGHNTGLTKQEAIDLIYKNGINRVDWIRHDDKSPVNQHRLDWDFLQIWKGVEEKKKPQIKILPV